MPTGQPDNVTLFERLGGDPAVQAAMRLLFERILDDSDLAPVFENVNVRSHVASTSRFVSAAAGGPKPWNGPDMRAAHRHLGVTNEQFDRVAAHLADALAELDVPDETASEVLELVGSLRSQIVLVKPATARISL
jgi:hemoglobin